MSDGHVEGGISYFRACTVIPWGARGNAREDAAFSDVSLFKVSPI